MTQVSFTADYDSYGQARRQLSVALPRGWQRAAPVQGALVSLGITEHASYDPAAGRNLHDAPTQYLVDRVAGSRSFEVDASAGAAAAYATATGQPLLLPALATDALAATGSRLPRRLLGHSQQYYDGAAFEGLMYGRLGRYGALTRVEVLMLTDELVQAAYGATPLLLAENPAWTSEYPQAFRDAPELAAAPRPAAAALPPPWRGPTPPRKQLQ